LLCAEGPRAVWLEGVCGPSGIMHWFDHRFEESDFADLEAHRDGVRWWTMCGVRESGDNVWHVLLPRGKVPLPAMDVWYPRVTARLLGECDARSR